METTGSARKKNLLSTLKVAGVFIPLCKFELLTLRQNKKFICFKQCSMPCLRSDIPSLIKCILNFTDVLNLSVVHFASKAVESPLSQLKLSVHFFLYSSETLHFSRTSAILKVPMMPSAFRFKEPLVYFQRILCI